MNKKTVKLPDIEFEIMKEIWNNETPISIAKGKEHLDKIRP